MNKEIADKWIAALKSGEYKQTKSVLNRDNNEFCCLGVLCELAIKEGLSIRKEIDDCNGEHVCFYDNSYNVLPWSVVKWARMKHCNGEFRDIEDKAQELTYINDNGKTFEEIANVISGYWKVL